MEGDSNAIATLVAAINDADAEVRVAAALAIGCLAEKGSAAAIGAVARKLGLPRSASNIDAFEDSSSRDELEVSPIRNLDAASACSSWSLLCSPCHAHSEEVGLVSEEAAATLDAISEKNAIKKLVRRIETRHDDRAHAQVVER